MKTKNFGLTTFILCEVIGIVLLFSSCICNIGDNICLNACIAKEAIAILYVLSGFCCLGAGTLNYLKRGMK